MNYPYIEKQNVWGNNLKVLITNERDFNWYSEEKWGGTKENFNIELRDIMQEGDIVFDIGANVGYLSCCFGLRVGKRGKVVSCEPLAANVDLIDVNRSINKLNNVHIVKCAVADKDNQFVHVSAETVICNIENKHTEQVQTKTIDELAWFYGHPNAIKMDIEGYEYHALLGATKTIERRKTKWAIEIHDSATELCSVRAWGKTHQDVFDIMLNYGYKCISDHFQTLGTYVLIEGKMVRKDSSDIVNNISAMGEYIFIPQ